MLRVQRLCCLALQARQVEMVAYPFGTVALVIPSLIVLEQLPDNGETAEAISESAAGGSDAL